MMVLDGILTASQAGEPTLQPPKPVKLPLLWIFENELSCSV